MSVRQNQASTAHQTERRVPEREQRRWPRREYSGGRLPPAARMRPGPPVVVVNLSRSGALIEGPMRPRAGSTCEFEFAGAAEAITTRARVARCFVARLEPSKVRYRTALTFDTLVPVPQDPDLLAGYQLPAAAIATRGRGVATPRDH